MGSIRIKTDNTGSSTDWKTVKRIHLSIASNIWTQIKSIWIFATDGWQLVRRWKNPENTALPSFTGTAAIPNIGLSIGSLLEGNDGSWTSEDGPITYAYQWLISDSSGGTYVKINGATNINFTPSVSTTYDDKFIRLQVEATNNSGSTIALSSAQRIVRNKPVGSTTNIVISGAAQTESTLSLSSPTNIVDAWNVTRLVTNDRRPTSYAYNWLYSDNQYATNNVLNSPTLTTYSITSADVGKSIKLRVTATNSGGSTDKDSNLTDTIVAAPGPWNITSATQAKPATRNGNRNLTINYSSSDNAASYEFRIDGYDPETDPLNPWVSLGNYTYTTTNSSSASFSVASFNGSTGSTYIYYRVTGRARNVNALTYSNSGTLSNPVFIQSTGTAPSAPTINSVSPLSTSAIVNFTGPTDTGSNFLVGTDSQPLYYYSLNNGADQSVTANSTTQLTIPNLVANTSYSVKIRAINNDSLLSNYSNSVNFTTTVAPPTNTVAPTITGTIKEGQQVTANVGSWTGSPTSYSIIWYGLKYSQQLGEYLYTNLGTGTNFTIPLNFNDLYDYLQIQVTATNSGGSTSAFSQFYSVITTTIPTITLNEASVSGTSVTISWTSTDQSTYSITGISGGPYDGTTQTSRTISGLSLNTTYNYTVTITSPTGDTASASGQFTTTVAPPTNTVAPSISGTVKEGQTVTANVGSWTGSPTSYSYQWQMFTPLIDGGIWVNVGSNSSSYFIPTNARNSYTQLRVGVTATNAGGSTLAYSPAYNIIDAIFPTISLNTPSTGTTSVTISWSSTNQASYSILISGVGTYTGTTATSRTISGLSSGTTYSYTVTVTSSTSDSASASGSFTTNTPAVIPTVTLGSPTNITNTSATVNWSSTNQASWSISGFPSSYSGSSQTSASISGLTAGTTYSYTVTVTSSTGNTVSASGSLTTTGGSAPSTPGTPSLVPISTRTWQASWSAVSGATSYTLYIQYSSNGSTVGSSTSISGIAGTTQTYSNSSWRYSRAAIQAVNSFGSSGISSYSAWRDGNAPV